MYVIVPLSIRVCVSVCVSAVSKTVLMAAKPLKPTSNDAATYDARHCVLCWVYGDSDGDVSLSVSC